MKIDSLKDLSKLIDLCHKKGVSNVEIDGIKLDLKEVPRRTYNKKSTSNDKPTEDVTEPTREELLMWSVGEFPGVTSNENN